jgi:hypothetical protein
MGNGLRRQALSFCSACCCSQSKTNVAVAAAAGSTLMDTSQMTPRMPSEPTIKRETS